MHLQMFSVGHSDASHPAVPDQLGSLFRLMLQRARAVQRIFRLRVYRWSRRAVCLLADAADPNACIASFRRASLGAAMSPTSAPRPPLGSVNSPRMTAATPLQSPSLFDLHAVPTLPSMERVRAALRRDSQPISPKSGPGLVRTVSGRVSVSRAIKSTTGTAAHATAARERRESDSFRDGWVSGDDRETTADPSPSERVRRASASASSRSEVGRFHFHI